MGVLTVVSYDQFADGWLLTGIWSLNTQLKRCVNRSFRGCIKTRIILNQFYDKETCKLLTKNILYLQPLSLEFVYIRCPLCTTTKVIYLSVC